MNDSENIIDTAINMNELSPEGKNVDFTKLLTKKNEAKYRINKVAGKGGMKDIYSARDFDSSRDIAMAVMLSSDNETDEQKKEKMTRFVYEARIAANLEHPNICPVHDIGVDSIGNPYFTMKLIGGENLQAILDQVRSGRRGYASKYTQQYLLEIFKKVCNAISFAHSKGVIHLDLKPENIQVGDYGEVLVLDWGLAKLLSEKEEDVKHHSSTKIYKNLENSNLDVTLDGVIKGTLGYMAPEQARGENSKKDFRTDIYGLGAILYTILTLEVPIIETHVNLILKATINGEIISPKMRVPQMNIAIALEAIAMKALSKKQDNRYQSVEDLIHDLDNYNAGFATNAEHATLLTQFFLFVKRNKIFVTAIIVSTIVTLTILIGFMHQLKEKENIAVLAKNRAEKSMISANEALNKIKIISEQTAPEFLTKAKNNIALQDWKRALKNINIAIDLNPNLLEAWYQKGRIHLALRNIKKAVLAFSKSKTVNILTTKTSIFFNTTLKFNNKEFAEAAKEINDFPLIMKLLEKEEESTKKMKTQLKACLESLKRLNPQQKTWKHSSKITKDGIILNLSYNKYLMNIQSLKGLPIIELNLSRCPQIDDISILKKCSIKVLNLSGNSKLKDYSVIKNFPLIEFYAGNLFSVKDMVFLENTKLKVLDLYYCKNIDNISILKGMPLEYLRLRNSEIIDISILRNMPIKSLHLSNCKNILDFTPLRKMKIQNLNLSGTGIIDLSILKGMSINSLSLSNTKIKNIYLLKNMPLRYLNMANCKNIKDVKLLKSCKSLEKLYLPNHLRKQMKYLLKHLTNLKK